MSTEQQQGGRESVVGASQICKVEGCERLMVLEDTYYRRYNVCKAHLRALELLVDGRIQRFCQQCGKFQDIADFDDAKRSCRAQLARHSLRRRIKLTEKRLQREQQQRQPQQQLQQDGQQQRQQQQHPALRLQAVESDEAMEDCARTAGPAQLSRPSNSVSRGQGGSSTGRFGSDAFQLADGDGDITAAEQPQPHGGRDAGRGAALVGWRDNGNSNGTGFRPGLTAATRARSVAVGSAASDSAVGRSGSGGHFCLDLGQPPAETLNLQARSRGGAAPADGLGPVGGAVLVSIARPGSSGATAMGAAPAAILVADRRAVTRGSGGGMGAGLPLSASVTLPQRQPHPALDGLAGPLSGPSRSGSHPGGEVPNQNLAHAAAPLTAGSRPSLGSGDAGTMVTPFTFPEAVLQLQTATSTPMLQQQKQPQHQQGAGEARRSLQAPLQQQQGQQQRLTTGLVGPVRDVVSPTGLQGEAPFSHPVQQQDHLLRGPAHWPAEPPPQAPLVLDGTDASGSGSGSGGGATQSLAQYSVFRDAQLLPAQPIVQDIGLEHELTTLLGNLVADQERMDEMYGTCSRATESGVAPMGGARAIGSGPLPDRAGPSSGPSSGSDQQSGPLGLLQYPTMASQSGPLAPPLLRKPQERLLQQQQLHTMPSSLMPTMSTSPCGGSGTGTGSGQKGAFRSGPDSDVDPAPHTHLVRDDLHMMSLNTGELDSLYAPLAQPRPLSLLQQQQFGMDTEPSSFAQHRSQKGEPSVPSQVPLINADAPATAVAATGMDWLPGGADGASGKGAGVESSAPVLVNVSPAGLLPGSGNAGYWIPAMPTPLTGLDHAGSAGLTGGDIAFISRGDASSGEGGTVAMGLHRAMEGATIPAAGHRSQPSAAWGAPHLSQPGSLCGAAGMEALQPQLNVPGTVRQQHQHHVAELSSRYVLAGYDLAVSRMQDAAVSADTIACRQSSCGDEGRGADGGGLWSSGGHMADLQEVAYLPPLPMQAQAQYLLQPGHQAYQQDPEQQPAKAPGQGDQQFLRLQEEHQQPATSALHRSASLAVPGATAQVQAPGSDPLQSDGSRQQLHQQQHDRCAPPNPHWMLFGSALSVHPTGSHDHHQAVAAQGATVAASVPHGYGSAPLPPPLPSYDSSESGQLLRRLSLKLHGCSPSDLMPDSRATIQSWLSSMNLSMLQLTTRSGCALLIADVLVPGGAGLGPGAGFAAQERPGGDVGCYSPLSLLTRMVGGNRPHPGAGSDARRVGAAVVEAGGVALPPSQLVAAAIVAAAPAAAAAAPLADSKEPLQAFASPVTALLSTTISPYMQEGSGVLKWGDSSSSATSVGAEAGGEGNVRGRGPAVVSLVDRTPASVLLDGSGDGSSGGGGGGGTESGSLANELLGKCSTASDISTKARDDGMGAPHDDGEGRDAQADYAQCNAFGEEEKPQQQRVLPAATLCGAAGVVDSADSGSTALGAAGQVSGSLSELLQQLLGPLMVQPEAGGGDGELADGQRLLLQLDDQVLCLTWLPRRADGPRAITGSGSHQGATAIGLATGGNEGGHAPASAPALPAARRAVPPPILLALRPAAIVAGRATPMQVAMQLPRSQLADALFSGATDIPVPGVEKEAPDEALEEEESPLLHLRFAGDCLVSCELKPEDLRQMTGLNHPPVTPPAVDEATKAEQQARSQLGSGGTTSDWLSAAARSAHTEAGQVLQQGPPYQGMPTQPATGAAGVTRPTVQKSLSASAALPHAGRTAAAGVIAEFTLHAPGLTAPGLAFLECSCGDLLGPWLPLPVVPSEAVAAEINLLSELHDRALLQPFLCDLGRLLMLRTAGACLEEAGYTDDWEAYEAYCELREAMPDAAVAAGRLLRTCVEWRLSECTALATSLFLALLNDPV